MQNTIKQTIQSAGLDCSVLDELVHESAALLAVQLEFSTITERVEFLLTERYTENDLVAHLQSEGYELKSLMPGDALALSVQLREADIPADAFSDLIQKTTSMTASSINNQGLDGQIDYLLEAGMTPATVLTRCGINTVSSDAPLASGQ